MTIHHRHALLTLCGILALASSPEEAGAQLNECALIGQLDQAIIPGGCIARTLAQQIGPGQGDIMTPGSSAYLIKRDPARAIRRGRQLFQRKFSLFEGLGPRVNANASGDITEVRRLGAGLSDSCAACHGRPRGSAGVGGDVATFPDSRDAPHLFGLGLIEMLADEMTTDLRAIRAQALREARTGLVATATGGTTSTRPMPVTRPLIAKGVELRPDHGAPRWHAWIRRPSEASTPNLRVKPFLHQGVTASIREFLVGAFHAEMGLQAADPVLCAATDPTIIAGEPAQSIAGFKYDPALDDFERPPACGEAEAGPGWRRQEQRDRSGARRLRRVLFAELLQAGPVPRDAASDGRSCADAAHRLHELPRAEPRRSATIAASPTSRRSSTPSAASSTTCSRRRRRCSRRSPDTAAYPQLQPHRRVSSSSATCSRT